MSLVFRFSLGGINPLCLRIYQQSKAPFGVLTTGKDQNPGTIIVLYQDNKHNDNNADGDNNNHNNNNQNNNNNNTNTTDIDVKLSGKQGDDPAGPEQRNDPEAGGHWLGGQSPKSATAKGKRKGK